MIASGERWRHSRKGIRILVPRGRHFDILVFEGLSPAGGRISLSLDVNFLKLIKVRTANL